MDHSTSLSHPQDIWAESFEKGLAWRRWCLFLYKLSPQFGLWSLLFFLLAPISFAGSFWMRMASLSLGVLILCAAIAFRLWTKGYSKVIFVREGPYQYVKNPIQLSALMAFLGIGLMMQVQAGALVLFLVFSVAFMSVFFKVQERELIAKHGNPMLRYGQRQRLWIPSRQARGGVEQQVFSWKRAIFEEIKDDAWYLLGMMLLIYLRLEAVA